MPAAVDITGKRFGRLVALQPTATRSGGGIVWQCECDCGAYTFVTVGRLQSTNTTSCGCRKKSVLGVSTTKHGGHGTRTYRIWKSLRNRCNNTKGADYKNYGGRGIAVCSRWDDYANFLSDMGEAPEELTIERVNNDGNYEPDNCKWATRLEQRHNQRPAKPRTKRGKYKAKQPIND